MQGSEIVYRYLVTGDVEGPIQEWTYAQLDVRARSLGALLQEAGARGERALLLYPPGLEFVAAFMGCLYAGVVAVPAYPPEPARMERTLPRLRAIIADCQARFVLTTTPILQMAGALLAPARDLAELRWIASDAPNQEQAASYQRPDIDTNDLAFLQYTSGSTGAPRGVMISHASILHNERLIAESFGHDATSIGVGWLPLFHDMGLIGNVLQPLYAGFPCTLMSPLAFLQRPLRWLQAVSTFRASTSGGPNFAYDLCVRKVSPEERTRLDLRSWTVAFNGAEPIRAETLDRFSDAFAVSGFRHTAFFPCYGLAEATLLVSGAHRHEPPVVHALSDMHLVRGRVVDAPDSTTGVRRLVSSGHVATDLEIAIVDPDTAARCEPDRIGEIWVRGPSLPLGYWNRPEDTRRTFAARLANPGEALFLRTGDLGFMRDGELFVTGRLKDLIILRGQNHYPQDIEQTVEAAHPCMRPGCSAAFAVEVAGQERLVVTAEVDMKRGAASAGDVVAAVRGAVSDTHGLHVHAVVLLEPRTIPKTSSGKIQRHACRVGYLKNSLAVMELAISEETESRAPAARLAIGEALGAAAPGERRALVEAFVMALVERGAGRATRDASFMGMGLDSLMMVELQGHMESALKLSLPSAFLWQYPTIAAASEKLLELWEYAGATPEAGLPPISARPEKTSTKEASTAPATPGQIQLWLLHQLAPESAAYNLHIRLRMMGPLQREALQASLDALVARYEILRTVFHEVNGEIKQVIRPPRQVLIHLIDFRDVPESERDGKLRRRAARNAARPFELDKGPLVRVALVMLGEDEHELLLVLHHIIADGWSMGLLVQDLATLYDGFASGAPVPLEPPLVQYADYARWQHETGDRRAASRAYWARTLAGVPRLHLPTDRPHPSSISYRGGAVSFSLSSELTRSLEALARREEVTLFVVLFAAYALLLHRCTGQSDFAVGTFVANRDRSDVRSIVGYLANTVALRCDFSGHPTVRELLQRVRQSAAEALTHAQLPFGEVVEVSRTARSASHHPLFQASFVLENLPVPELNAGGMHWRTSLDTPTGSVSGTAKFDVELQVARAEDGLVAVLEYNADVFDEATVARMRGHFETLLRGAVETPAHGIGHLTLLAAEERHEIIGAWNLTTASTPRVCAHELFEERAMHTPEAIAVVEGERTLTYAELNQRANQVAHHLRSLGVEADDLVGLCMSRSIEMVVALLGIWKAGGAFVPLEPRHPPERFSMLMRGAGLSILISRRALVASLPVQGATIVDIDDILADDTGSRAALEVRSAPEHLAYVMYTSGSTGTPKGVMITHAGLVNYVLWSADAYNMSNSQGSLVHSSLLFDLTVTSLIVPLVAGNRIELLPDDGDIELLAAVLRENRGYSMIKVTPSHLGMLEYLLRDARIDDLARCFVIGGEALSGEQVAFWRERAPEMRIFNEYGPTETVVGCCVYEVADSAAGAVPIGRPIANTQVYVLDPYLQPAPIGVTGELFIGGAGVARGYLAQPALTAWRFIPDPFSAQPGRRMYRTGDLAKWRADGTLEFLGRTDHQVKVRGFRIEPGEIEAVLDAYPSVRDSVVIARHDAPGEAHLVAYVTVERPVALAELNEHMQRALPAYMVPSKVVILDELPLTENGKIDRRSLPAPDAHRPELAEAFVAPRTSIEVVLAAILAEVLGIDRVGIHDDFFALGGHSLLAARVVSRVRELLDVDLPMRAFFETATVAGLAPVIQGKLGASITGERPIMTGQAELEEGEL